MQIQAPLAPTRLGLAAVVTYAARAPPAGRTARRLQPAAAKKWVQSPPAAAAVGRCPAVTPRGKGGRGGRRTKEEYEHDLANGLITAEEMDDTDANSLYPSAQIRLGGFLKGKPKVSTILFRCQ